MATVGTLIVNLALNSAGFAPGLAGAKAQLEAFQAQMTGATRMAAAERASQMVTRATNEVTLATARAEIANLSLTRVQGMASASAEQLAAAQLRVTATTIALADAQMTLAAAEKIAAHPPMMRGNAFPLITIGATIASFAILKFGEDSVKAASRFEYTMKLIQTQAGASAAQIKGMSESLLEMAGSVQTGPEELAKGLFHVESVGYRGADALNVLATAARGAVVGNADLEAVTNALVATITTGIKGTNNLDEVMGVLNATVGVGNLRMQDLAASLSSGVLSTAKQFGLSIEDVGAALATMADQGIPAEEAATRLRITIALLGAPTKIAAQQLRSIGLSQRDIADAMRKPDGLIGALTLLKTKMDDAGLDAVQQSMLLKTSFGGSRSSAGILVMINSLELMARKKADIEKGKSSFGEQFAAESATAEAGFKRLSAVIDVLSIRLGNGLLVPIKILTNAMAFLVSQTLAIQAVFAILTPLVAAFAVVQLGKLIVSLYNGGLGVLRLGHAMRTLAGLQQAEAAAAATATTATTDATTATTGLTAGLDRTAVATTGVTTAAEGMAAALGTVDASLAGVDTALSTTAAATTPVVTGLMSVDDAMASTFTATGPLVAGFAGVDGAIAATTEATGPLVAGFAGADGAMAATTQATGPLIAGFAGADGAIAATVESTGPLVAGFAGVDGAIAATTQSTGPLVAGLAGIDGAQEATVASSGPLIAALEGEATAMAGLAVAEDAATVGLAGMAPVAVATGGVLAGLRGMITSVAAGFTMLLGPISLFAMAGILLVTNWDRVMQGIRVIIYGIIGLIKTLVDVVAQVPVLGEPFKALSKTLQEAQDGMVRDMSNAEGEISAKADQFGSDVTLAINRGAAKGIATSGPALSSATASLIEQWGTDNAAVTAAAMELGAKDMEAYAKGILESQQAPVNGYKALLTQLKDNLTPAQEIARDVGILSSKALADGLVSMNPATQAAAEALRKSTSDSLDLLTNDAYSAGTEAGLTWQDAFVKSRMLSGVTRVDAMSELNNLTPENAQKVSESFNTLGELWRNKLAPSAAEAAAAVKGLDTTLTDTRSIGDQVTSIFATMGSSLDVVDKIGETSGSDLMLAVAKGIRDKQNAPLDALKGLHSMMGDELSKNREIALLWAERQSKDLADGLKSSDPAVRAQAIATLKLITDRLDELTGGAYSASLNAGVSIGKGLDAASDVVTAGAESAVAGVGPVMDTETMRGWNSGSLMGSNFGAGAASTAPAVAAGTATAVGPAEMILSELERRAGAIGESTGLNHAAGLAGQSVAAGQAAAKVSGPIAGVFTALATWMHGAGEAAGNNFNAGMTGTAAHPGKVADDLSMATVVKLPDTSHIKSFADILNEALKSSGDMTAYLNSQLESVGGSNVFNNLKDKMMEFFDKLHDRNLQAIHDAHDHKNALLDAKEALNQAPVTAAQKALDFQRKAIQEWRLRMAVANARDPESQRDAILALNDFLAQKHIDQMQEEVDNNKERLDAQKKANDDHESAAVKAENKRYEQQKKDFSRQLTALEDFLKKHPAEWAKTQNKIIALLGTYGVSYKNMGSALGSDFAAGLRSQLPAVVAAATTLAKAGKAAGGGWVDPFPGKTADDQISNWPSFPMGTTYIGPRATGDWQIRDDNSLALLHKGEMVVPSDLAGIFRSLGKGYAAPGMGSAISATSFSPRAGRTDIDRDDRSGPRGGGGTIIFQVGDEVMGEVIDHRLAIQSDMHRTTLRPSNSPRR